MLIGCPKEIKNQEYRVGLTPANAADYIAKGHKVIMEKGAGEGSGFTDEEYKQVGAEIADKKRVFEADMIIKVKEPIEEEYECFREGQILYTYLHLAADKPLTEMLLKKKIRSIAYETMKDEMNQLPCLAPMSGIAGRLSIQEAAKYMEKKFGGQGILLGGVPGVQKANVVILGAGVVGFNAAQMAMGIGANVSITDVNLKRLEYIDHVFNMRINTYFSAPAKLEELYRTADVVIGSVLIPGAKAPKLLRKEHLKIMKKGAVIVDVAIDQGGCFETSHATTHDDPIFIEDGVVHYCVANMPGAVARTSTIALTNATTHYGVMLADKGLEEICKTNNTMLTGLNTYNGKCTFKGVAEAFGIEYTDPKAALGC
ncbi:alanine dehydrogenase [uncultured Brachyspira sp.]|uniref:alanine dehydrogenase n=1 Tax=uncultured Brachyspira sp. TaxID=221953 RepID=UPI002628D5AA|nr:alanine dehydrogenase [uncultured Brachyspira sp.]